MFNIPSIMTIIHIFFVAFNPISTPSNNEVIIVLISHFSVINIADVRQNNKMFRGFIYYMGCSRIREWFRSLHSMYSMECMCDDIDDGWLF